MNTTISPENFDHFTTPPSAAVLMLSPGESQLIKVSNLLRFAVGLERKNRERMLLMGAVFSRLKQLYREYTKALYRAGFRKDEVATYQQFKAESGFSIPSNPTISNYTQVYACYVEAYGLAKLQEEENQRLSFSWVDPLLLAAPFEMLLYLIRKSYHNNADRAREILYNLQPSVMKRSEFWLWLDKQPIVRPLELNPDIVDTCDPLQKPYQNSLEETFEAYQLAAPDFWQEIAKKIAVPADIKRPLRVTITVNEVEYGG